MNFSFPVLFAAGVVSFASPCVLPMMPMYLATLASGSVGPEAGRGRTLSVGAAFAAGISTVFVALGAFAGPLGAALAAYRPWLLGASGLLLLALGLRGVGALRVDSLDQEARPLLTRVRLGSGVVAAFVFGAAFALGWSPCIGPVLASVLTFAATNTHSAWESAAYLAVYAAGFSTPLLVLAALTSRAASWVRSVGRYTPIVERVSGAAMLLGAAVALIASYQELRAGRTVAHVEPASAPNVAPTADATPPAGCDQAAEGTTCVLPLGNEVSEGAGVSTHTPAAAPGNRVGRRVVEVIGRHCPVCERMRPVLAEVDAACERTGTAVESVDVGTPEGRAIAARFGVRGTPTFLFLDDDGAEITRVIGETSTRRFVDTVERSFGLTCLLDAPTAPSAAPTP